MLLQNEKDANACSLQLASTLLLVSTLREHIILKRQPYGRSFIMRAYLLYVVCISALSAALQTPVAQSPPALSKTKNTNPRAEASPAADLLPASRQVALKFFDRPVETNDFTKHKVLFHSQLSRRNGIEIYGRAIVHSKEDPRHAELAILDGEEDKPLEDDSSSWDALLREVPDHHLYFNNNPNPLACFVAMNRFRVKPGCEHMFEERWSQRKTMLTSQPGFVGFFLLRKNTSKSTYEHEATYFNYSTCTIWSSHGAWNRWRDGEGRHSHDASKKNNPTRMPMSELLESPASPIFWEGRHTFLSQSGV